MDKKFLVPLGILVFFIGVTLVLNSVSSITGLVVIEEVNIIKSSFAGTRLILFGIVLFILGSEKNSKFSPFN